MRIIILGVGQVGESLVKKLSQEDHDVVVIDNNEEKLRALEDEFDIMTVLGNGVLVPTLLKAGIEKADLFIAVTNHDEINILACIFANEFGVQKSVARVSDDSFSENPDFNLNTMGIDLIIHPEKSAADNIVKLIRQSGATDIIQVGGGKMQITGFRIDSSFPFINKPLKSMNPEQPLSFRTVAIKRGNKTIVPKGDDIIKEGDNIYVLVCVDEFEHLIRFLGMPKYKIKNVMILGAGQIGLRVAKSLENELNVKIIESNYEKSVRASNELVESLVISGDGTDNDLLIQEGISEMDIFIAATGDDETNFISTLLAKQLKVPRTIAVVNKVHYLSIAPKIGLDSVVCPYSIVVNETMKFVRGKKILSVASIMGVDAEAIDLIVNPRSSIAKKPLKDIHFPSGAIVGGIIHDNIPKIATGSSFFHPGDRAIVFALPSAIERVEKLLVGDDDKL